MASAGLSADERDTGEYREGMEGAKEGGRHRWNPREWSEPRDSRDGVREGRDNP